MNATTFTSRGRQVTIGRAPKGGIEFGGKSYRGGQFCPLAAVVPVVAGGSGEAGEVKAEEKRRMAEHGLDPEIMGWDFCREMMAAIEVEERRDARDARRRRIENDGLPGRQV